MKLKRTDRPAAPGYPSFQEHLSAHRQSLVLGAGSLLAAAGLAAVPVQAQDNPRLRGVPPPPPPPTTETVPPKLGGKPVAPQAPVVTPSAEVTVRKMGEIAAPTPPAAVDGKISMPIPPAKIEGDLAMPTAPVVRPAPPQVQGLIACPVPPAPEK